MAVHVHVNCAITLDGCMGAPGRKPLQISNPEDKRRVHAMRADSDAILVGVGTILADDPHLTVKWDLLKRTGKNPLRVVLDPNLRTPPEARVLNGNAPTLLVTGPKAKDRTDAETLCVSCRAKRLDLSEVLDGLQERGVRKLMVEGGPTTLHRFFHEDKVDEATIFIAPFVVGSRAAPRFLDAPTELRKTLALVRAEVLGDGLLAHWARA